MVKEEKVTISIQITKEQYEWVRQRHWLNLSALIRDLLDEYIKENKEMGK